MTISPNFRYRLHRVHTLRKAIDVIKAKNFFDFVFTTDKNEFDVKRKTRKSKTVVSVQKAIYTRFVSNLFKTLCRNNSGD